MKLTHLATALALALPSVSSCVAATPRTPAMTQLDKVVPCFWFQGDAEAAARRYVELIPDSRILSIARYGEGAHLPAGTEMLVQLEIGGTQIWLLNGGPQFKLSEAASIAVRCADQAEIDRLWSALGEGGREMACGWLADRWGVSWQIVPAKFDEWMAGPPERGARMLAALTGMVKPDIEALQRAYDGR